MKHTITIDLPEPYPTPPEGWHLVDYRFVKTGERYSDAWEGKWSEWRLSDMSYGPHWVIASNPEPPPASAIPDGWELDGYRPRQEGDERYIWQTRSASMPWAVFSSTSFGIAWDEAKGPFRNYWWLRKKPEPKCSKCGAQYGMEDILGLCMKPNAVVWADRCANCQDPPRGSTVTCPKCRRVMNVADGNPLPKYCMSCDHELTIPTKQGPPPIPAPYCDMWEHTGKFRQPMVGEPYLPLRHDGQGQQCYTPTIARMKDLSEYWILRQKLTPDLTAR